MLKKIKNILFLVFFAISFFIGCWIYIDNNILVDLSLFGLVLPRLNLGLVLLSVFSLGVLCGLFGNVLVIGWMSMKIRQLQKKVSGASAEEAG
jgi:hypothetical protein